MKHENFYTPSAKRAQQREVSLANNSEGWNREAVIAFFFAVTLIAALAYASDHSGPRVVAANYAAEKHAADPASPPTTASADISAHDLATPQTTAIAAPAPANAAKKEAQGNVVDMTY